MKPMQQRLAGCLLLATILGSCKQVASQQTPGEGATNTGDLSASVSWQARPGNIYFNKEDGAGYYYLYINVRGNESASKRKRVPLNISLVLDRSGSMAGSKIAYAKKAAAFVVDQLNNEDIVSVVNYDDRVEVTSSAQPVKNKELLKQRINELFDRGSTNLTGGMLEGYTQVKANRREGYVNRVLLLTDGLANQGITDPAQMKKIVEKKYAEEGIALSTFGLGADYNEDLLTMLAEMGRANYYFIDNPDKIPAVFASELKGLLSVVAQNTWVEVDIPQQLECDKVYGYPFEKNGRKVIVRLNDLFANDEKGILIRCRRNQTVSEPISFNCQLHFTDAVSFNSLAKEKTVVIRPTADHGLLREGEDMMVQEMIALFESTEAFDDVMTKVDAGNYDQAKQVANAALYKLQEKQKTIRSEKLKKQEETLSTYTKRIEEVKTMREEDKKIHQKSNKAVNYGVKKGKN